MKVLSLIPLSFLLVVSHAQAGSETLLCIADLSTGFRMDNKEWMVAGFKVEGKRYIVKPVPTRADAISGKINYEVTEFGEKVPSHRCFRSEGAEGMACGGLGWGFVVNFRTLRFQDYYGIGFVDGRDDGNNTPALTIGKCSLL